MRIVGAAGIVAVSIGRTGGAVVQRQIAVVEATRVGITWIFRRELGVGDADVVFNQVADRILIDEQTVAGIQLQRVAVDRVVAGVFQADAITPTLDREVEALAADDRISTDDGVVGIGHANAGKASVRDVVALNQDVGIVGRSQLGELIQQTNAAEALGSHVLHRVVLHRNVD